MPERSAISTIEQIKDNLLIAGSALALVRGVPPALFDGQRLRHLQLDE
jgi:hypothetical protein